MKAKLLTTLILFIVTLTSEAQSGDSIVNRDLETWSAASVEFKLNKKWDLALEQQLRLKDNSSTIDVYFTEIDVQYKLSQPLTLGLAGRFNRENDDKGKIQGYENHVRGAFYIRTKTDLSRLALKSRLQYQIKDELGVSVDNGDTLAHVIRLKAGIEYNIKNWKLDPKLSGELFKNMNPDSDFSKYRITFGTSYKINKNSKLSAFYRLEKQLKLLQPKTTNIIGAKFAYSIN